MFWWESASILSSASLFFLSLFFFFKQRFLSGTRDVIEYLSGLSKPAQIYGRVLLEPLILIKPVLDLGGQVPGQWDKVNKNPNGSC